MDRHDGGVPALPRDVVGLILRHVSDVPTLLACSCVSKTFSEIVTAVALSSALPSPTPFNMMPISLPVGRKIGDGGFCSVFVAGACESLCIKIATKGSKENSEDSWDFQYDVPPWSASSGEDALTRLVFRISSGELVARFLGTKEVDTVVAAEYMHMQSLPRPVLASSLLPRVLAGGKILSRYSDSRSFIIMERINGFTLREAFRCTFPELQGGGRLQGMFSMVDVRPLFIDLLDAMVACNVSHGDLKPENIMIETKGRQFRMRLIDPAPVNRFFLGADHYAGTYLSDMGDAASMAAVLIEACEGKPMHDIPEGTTLLQVRDFQRTRKVALNRLRYSKKPLVRKIVAAFGGSPRKPLPPGVSDDDCKVTLKHLAGLLRTTETHMMLNIPAGKK